MMMPRYKNVMTVFGAAVLAIGLAACSSSDKKADEVPPVVVDPEPPMPTELETAQAAAAAAAAAAMTASGNAETAAAEAATAVENSATMQTNATAEGLATEAQDAAAAAKKANMDANAASEAAAAATTTTAAVEARVAAMEAQADAEKHAMTATEKSDAAKEAAMAELMIDGTMKTVGTTTIDATAGSHTRTVDGETTITGLLAKAHQPMTTGTGSTAVPGVNGDPDASPNPYKAPVAEAANRAFPIGKLVDSADDTDRLMLVTQYAGTRTVKVYAEAGGTDLAGELGSDGRIQTVGADTEATGDDIFVSLKSAGSYYLAGTSDNLDEETDVVGTEAKAVHVYYFVDDGDGNPNNARDDDPANDERVYVVRGPATTSGDGETTTITYENVDIHITDVDRDGDADTDNALEVTAKIPEATEYKHIHFGVWAGLGDAEKDGSQELDNLGIGFVQSIGDGLSGDDMPNNGDATYSGNWVAAIRAADEDGDGAISLTSGAASLTADFGDDEITATLTGLATLEGDISGNTFSGTKATATHSSLDADGKFEGSFSGGFYGAKAAEAGGIFDFTSEDAEAGEFRGAFGADRDPE